MGKCEFTKKPLVVAVGQQARGRHFSRAKRMNTLAEGEVLARYPIKRRRLNGQSPRRELA
jgi:hypothetical protein